MVCLQELDHLKIPFEDIKSATNNFYYENANDLLGQGAFGRVYKGQLSSSTRPSDRGVPVAVKRLDMKRGQGEREFLKEIVMLASYKHENLVSLVGFSVEGNEKVLVYKQEVNGSLDNHLDSTNLTWVQRLRICLGVGKGLEYLHGGVGGRHRVLHRDIKSSNILLDDNWEAKISDFGLSTIGPANQQLSFLATNACGTLGYFDPQYVSTGLLTKESDVYSFGVVLFEVLCGRLAMCPDYEDERTFLSRLVKLRQEKGTLHEIIMSNLLEQMNPFALQVFSNIAFQCLNKDRKQRPRISLVVKSLENALNHQLGTTTRTSICIWESVTCGFSGTKQRPTTGLVVKGLAALIHHYGTRQTKLWGSMTGGTPFLFQLQSNQKLRKIAIISDSENRWIHGLIFTAEDSNGLLHSSEQFGGLHDYYNQRDMDEIGFDDDEEIIGISGTMGMCHEIKLITALSFETNKTKYGPYGEENDGNTKFSQSWDLGSFYGFYGRCGSYLDAVGCCLKTGPVIKLDVLQNCCCIL